MMSLLEDGFQINSIQMIMYFIFFCTCFWLYRKLDRNNYFQKSIPGMKIRFFNILGHFSNLPRGSTHLQLCPINAYFLQFLMSFRQLFPNNNFFIVWVLNLPFLVLHKAESIEAISKSNTVLRKARTYDLIHPWLNTGLLTSWGPKWKVRRKLLTPSFHFDILKDFLPVINKHSQTLVQILGELSKEEWIDTLKVVTLCSLDVICETTLGVDINAQRNKDSDYLKAVFRTCESIITRSFSPFQWFDYFYFKSKSGLQLKKDINTLHSFTKEVIQKKKHSLRENVTGNKNHSKRKALMDLLLDYHMTHSDFTEEDIREEVDTFAFEGHDTTSMGLTWTMYLVGLYPDVQKAIHEELDAILTDDYEIINDDLGKMKYLECVIKETLRLYPSVPITGRQVEQDTKICGNEIPKGTEIMLFIYGLHRDPDVFPNPEIFDPNRFLPENTNGRNPYAYVPFAAGPRNCIGQRFAMMELKVILATVFKHYEVKSLDPRDKILPIIDVVLRPSHPIRIKITPR